LNASFYPRCGEGGPADFTAFSYFLMACEDKTSLTAITLWFKVCDLDEDGVLSLKEIEELYDLQRKRMIVTGNEIISFHDVLTQLWDMINPINPLFVTLADLVRSKTADVFFNMLFDLQKFLLREYHYPVIDSELDELKGKLTPWEVYVLVEYERLIANSG
jgi:serine/threonine-protein phosphatase 2A regulatory subunit B''